MAWYVFDVLEIIMGPYDTEEEAIRYLDIFVTECYLLDQFPNPYIQFMEEDYFNIEDWEYEHYRWAEDSMLPVRENIRKKRIEFR